MLEELCHQAPDRRDQLHPTQNRSQAAEPGHQSARDASRHVQSEGGGQHRHGQGKSGDDEARGRCAEACRVRLDSCDKARL